MVSLLSEIERAKRADTLAEFARNEAAMADRLVTTGRTPLSDGDGALAGGFAQWCAKNKVRHCPARPAVVARFISEIAHQGEETVLATIQAIDLLHDFHGMANPTATAAVRIALESIVKVEPPRSWPKADKILFARLPPEIRAVIAERERQRETEMRRAQNAAAAKRASDGPDPKTVNTEGNKMAKSRSLSGADCREILKREAGVTQGRPDAYVTGAESGNRDISGIVEKNSVIDGGYSGALHPETKK